jgi:hypothetical protein
MPEGPVEVVGGYADLISDPKLRGDDPDVIGRELQSSDDEEIVAWVPDWLVDEKDVDTVAGSGNVLSGQVDYETEKAYLVVVGRDEAWLPKSVIRVFEATDEADLTVPQTGITEFGTGAEEGETDV